MRQTRSRYFLGLNPLGRLGMDQSFRQEFEQAEASLEFQDCLHGSGAEYGLQSARKVEHELYKHFAGVPVSIALFEIVRGWPKGSRLNAILSVPAMKDWRSNAELMVIFICNMNV
jgi:hypothetical protein